MLVCLVFLVYICPRKSPAANVLSAVTWSHLKRLSVVVVVVVVVLAVAVVASIFLKNLSPKETEELGHQRTRAAEKLQPTLLGSLFW